MENTILSLKEVRICHTVPVMMYFRISLILLSLFTVEVTLHAQEKSPFAIPATDEGLPGEGPIRRYDWFSKLWQNKRSGWANEVEKDQNAVVFLGDSITQGWGPNMKGAFADMKVANRGISGDTTRGMLIRMEQDVLSLNPSAVVMLMGTNDLEEGAEPAVIAANFKLIVEALKKHNDKMPIVVCEVMPSSASKKRPADKIKAINDGFKSAVKGDAQITVVDTWSLFADENGDAKKAEFPDLLHPNQIGYQMWGAALTPILATHGFLEKETDAFEPEEGFELIFNGKDLTGWRFKATPAKQRKPGRTIIEEDIAFDGKTESNDGRYLAKNGKLIVTTPPQGRRIQQLWTTQEFPKDFVLKLEFRATPNADSGIFIRKPQLQCRDYPIAGPYKELKNYKTGDWNEIVVTVKGNVAHCTCNGEVLEAEFKVPSTGSIGLEGDRGQMEYRRIRVREL